MPTGKIYHKYRWNWSKAIGVLATWIKEYGNKPKENGPAEITNLILVCLNKLQPTKDQIKHLNVIQSNLQLEESVKVIENNPPTNRMKAKAKSLLMQWENTDNQGGIKSTE